MLKKRGSQTRNVNDYFYKRQELGHKKSGPRFIKLKVKRYELVLIAHLHMRIVKIQRVGQSARILPIHVKEGDIRGKSTSFL